MIYFREKKIEKRFFVHVFYRFLTNFKNVEFSFYFTLFVYVIGLYLKVNKYEY